MDPARFDRVAKALGAETTRRRIVWGIAGAVLTGGALIELPGRRALGQTEATPPPAPEVRPDFPPIFVSPPPFQCSICEIGPGPGNRGPLESMCGIRDDSEDVEMYKGDLGVTKDFVVAHQAPVGNLRWNTGLGLQFSNPGNVEGQHYCSGTLVADDLFLTAGHCFNQNVEDEGWVVPRINGTDTPVPRIDIAKNMSVSFNYQWTPNFAAEEPETIIAVTDLVEDGLGEGTLDYAIVRLAANPGPSFLPARVAAADPPVGSELCIIGHPRGFEKRIAAGSASQFQDANIYYDDIDTDGGSSGSGILSSPDGNIIGIHTNGGCDNPAFGNNHGLRISALLQASPILRGILASQLQSQ